MNLHGIAIKYVGMVNSNILVTIQKSTGYVTAPDGTRTPTYDVFPGVQAQMQSLQYNDIAQLSGMNIQGQKRALYLNGDWDGLVRNDGKGGDIITFPDGTIWLVVMVLEDWAFKDGWVKVAITQQLT